MKIYLYVTKDETTKEILEVTKIVKTNLSIDVKTPDGFWDKINVFKTPEECNRVYNALMKIITFNMKRAEKDFIQVKYDAVKNTINNIPISGIQVKEETQMTL